MIDMKKKLESKNIHNNYKKNFKDALKKESFKSLVSSVNADEEALMKNTSNFLISSEEFSNCLKCKGLPTCKNEMVGYAYMPSVRNENLSFCYKPCKYKKKLEKNTEYLNNIYLFEMPKEIREAKMKYIYKDDKNRFNTIKYLVRFMDDYKKEKQVKGLYLHGNFGCGKTYLVSAMFNELAMSGVKSAIVYYPELLRKLKASFNTNYNDIYEKIKKSPLLLLDDIGAENTTVWGRDEVLGPLIQYRMSENLPTFFTSNLDLNALPNHFSTTKDKVDEVKAARIMERIKQLTVEEKMVSENLRR